MKKLYKYYFLIILLGGAIQILKAQDPVYSHFWVDKLYLNPALAGSDKGLSATMMMRYQWPKITSDFAVYGVSISSFEPNLSGGIGFTAMQHVEGEGIQKTSEFSFTYSYKILDPKKRRWELDLGIRVGYLQRNIDFSKLIFSDQLDPVNGLIYTSQAELPPGDFTGAFNANTGLDLRFFTSKKQRSFINIGFSANNITRPKFSLLYLESCLPIRYSVYGSLTIPVSPWSGKYNYIFKPMFMHTRQGTFQSSDMRLTSIGIQTASDRIFGGVYFRSAEVYNLPRRDALFFNFGFNWISRQTTYSFSYGYDLNVSNLGPNTGGSHEFALLANIDEFRIFKNLNSLGRRMLKHCPDFKPIGGLKTL